MTSRERGGDAHRRSERQGDLHLVATCGLGLEELLRDELLALGHDAKADRGAVLFRGDWAAVWRANWRLRTANRVLVRLVSWRAADDKALAAGAERIVHESKHRWAGVAARDLFDPERTLAVRATSRRSALRDTRWIALRFKDGVVDAQRAVFGKRSSVDRQSPDLSLRILLDNDVATLLLDTSGAPLDRRGYRLQTGAAPLRENLAAACVLASRWDGKGPIVDPMCGTGTLLAEAGSWAIGRAPGATRSGWAFEKLPGFDRRIFAEIRRETIPALAPRARLFGADLSQAALEAARGNLSRAGLDGRVALRRADAFRLEPPAGPGLVLVNPPHGERLADSREQWSRLGDLLKQRYQGWRAVVLAGGEDRGKHIGLRPSFRLPVRNGPLDARILGFEIY